jgi:hypothetical protein
MDDHTVEHLKLISNVVDRMGRNSFHLKGWAVILVAAIFAFASREVDYRFYLVGLLPAVTFWGLDGYYLWQEKYFRALYNAVRTSAHDIEKYGLFSMNTKPYDDKVPWWGRVCVSRTIFPVYVALVVIIALASSIARAIEMAD